MSDERLWDSLAVIAAFFGFPFFLLFGITILGSGIMRFFYGDLLEAFIYFIIYFSLYSLLLLILIAKLEEGFFVTLGVTFIFSLVLIFSALVFSESVLLWVGIIILIYPWIFCLAILAIGELSDLMKKKKERYERLKAELIEEMD